MDSKKGSKNCYISDEKIRAEVEEVIEIIQQLYDIWLEEYKRRLDNIKRINIDSVTELIKHERLLGRVQTRKDIIRYIEGITQD